MNSRELLDNIMPRVSAFSGPVSILWLVVYLFFVAVLVYQTYSTLEDYFSHPVVVTLSIETNHKEVEFPAVTLCNNNIVKKSMIARIPYLQDLAFLDSYTMGSLVANAKKAERVTCSTSTEFKCRRKNLCIPMVWLCNGVSECGDNSDESPKYNCTNHESRNLNDTCAPGLIQCPEETVCAQPCDNINECTENPGYDESAYVGCPLQCGGVFQASAVTQSIESPNYPKMYNNSLNCEYKITAPLGQLVEIQFGQFQLQNSKNCQSDYVTIRDGVSYTDSYVAINNRKKVCGEVEIDPVQSTSNGMIIHFSTDDVGVAKGWTLNYTALNFFTRTKRSISYSSNSSEDHSGNENENYTDYSSEETLYDYHSNSFDYTDSTATTTDNPVITDPDNAETTVYSWDYDYYSGDYNLGFGKYGYYEYYDDYQSWWFNQWSHYYTSYYSGESTYSDYYYDYHYYSYFVPASNFKDVKPYNWYNLYRKSIMPDYSDMREFIRLHPAEILGNGHQKEDFIIQCVFDKQLCSSANFHIFQSPKYGNCFSFNSVGVTSKPALTTTKVGSKYGLKLTLFLDKDEYIGVIGQKSGAKLSLHGSKESPSLDTKGVFLSAGTATALSLKYEEIEREKYPFSSCAQTWPSFLELSDKYKKLNYNKDKCKYFCIQRKVALSCDCGDTFEWDFSANMAIQNKTSFLCDIWDPHIKECLDYVYSNFTNDLYTCDCPVACKQRDIVYTSSNTEWPTEAYAPYLMSLLQRSTSRRVHEFVAASLNSSDLSPSYLKEIIQTNFVHVEIQFETLNKFLIKETPKYNLQTFFGVLGGNMGLWLGWSILSALDIIQWFFSTIMVFIIRKKVRSIPEWLWTIFNNYAPKNIV